MANTNWLDAGAQRGGAGVELEEPNVGHMLSAWGDDINRELGSAFTALDASLGSFYNNMQAQDLKRSPPTAPPRSSSRRDPSSVDIHLELIYPAKTAGPPVNPPPSPPKRNKTVGPTRQHLAEQNDRTAALPPKRRRSEEHHRRGVELPHTQDATRLAQAIAARSLLPHSKRRASAPLRTLQLGNDKNARGEVNVTLTPGACTPATASKIATWMHTAPLLWGAPPNARAPEQGIHANLPPAKAAKAAHDAPARDAKGVERARLPPPQPTPHPINPVTFPAPACRKSAGEQKSAGGGDSLVLAGAYAALALR